MPAPAAVSELIARFHAHLTTYKQSVYNEEQLRIEFLNPLFKALGWDMDNVQGYAEQYKEVIHEDALKVSGVTKAPDYAFRIGGQRKFFLEAKKPSVNIKDDVHPAYQLRRYAWSAKLPLSILSDFEEFAVYDCRIKPEKNDPASTARVLYFRYTDYVDRWDELAGIFAKESILKGSFDQYVESHKAKRGTAEVDAAFLGEIERWRELLARNFALRNAGLTQRELNFAVQQTIDRLIFLRIAEDRGIEPYGTLMGLQNGANTYSRLLEIFQQADARYNSGLFHFGDEKGQSSAPDTLTPALALDDKALKDILKNLYYPDSPYEFSVLPADILGQVYERFLGKVIRLTAGHQAKVEEKPEVRKAGGVFYTPTYIVDYIVDQTLGKLLEERTPGPRGTAADLRLVDMACGSGTFLLGLYQTLLDWHLVQYTGAAPEKWARGRNPTLYQTQHGDWRLTLEERKRILLASIYGVDIDAQAVEVTKLSLLLKLLEGEDRQTLAPQLALLPDRILPDLARNIRCGNALIGPDFYDGQMALLDEEEAQRVNVFDWQAAFPEVFARGGFDAVVGNPPYVRQEELSLFKSYFTTHYESFRSTADLYVNFIEKGIRVLRETGLFGMIVSNKWIRTAYGQPLRSFLLNRAALQQIVDFAGLPVFAEATVRTVILICARQSRGNTLTYIPPVSTKEFQQIRDMRALAQVVAENARQVPVETLATGNWSLYGDGGQRLLDKLVSSTTRLRSYLGNKKPLFGIKTGLNEAFVVDETTRAQLVAHDASCAKIIRPIVGGRDLRRYELTFNAKYLIWTYVGVPIGDFPAILEHLKKYQPALEKRTDKGQYWWELRSCDYYSEFDEPKIIYPDIATGCRFILDREGYFGTNTTYMIPGDNPYLLGILNSRLGLFYFKSVCAGLEGKNETYLRFFGQYLEGFPVRTIDFTDPADMARHDQMVALVERMLDLHRRQRGARTPQDKAFLETQIAATDRAIDQLVYTLYGLSVEEIAIVEGKDGS